LAHSSKEKEPVREPFQIFLDFFSSYLCPERENMDLRQNWIYPKE